MSTHVSKPSGTRRERWTWAMYGVLGTLIVVIAVLSWLAVTHAKSVRLTEPAVMQIPMGSSDARLDYGVALGRRAALGLGLLRPSERERFTDTRGGEMRVRLEEDAGVDVIVLCLESDGADGVNGTSDDVVHRVRIELERLDGAERGGTVTATDLGEGDVVRRRARARISVLEAVRYERLRVETRWLGEDGSGMPGRTDAVHEWVTVEAGATDEAR